MKIFGSNKDAVTKKL